MLSRVVWVMAAYLSVALADRPDTNGACYDRVRRSPLLCLEPRTNTLVVQEVPKCDADAPLETWNLESRSHDILPGMLHVDLLHIGDLQETLPALRGA